MTRAWDEYLAWTRNATPGEYEATEAKAWARLEAAELALRVVPFDLPEPTADLDAEAVDLLAPPSSEHPPRA